MTQPEVHETEHGPAGKHGGHGWLMLVCCVPMLVLVVALVATGVASAGALLFAGVCVGMMFMMMRSMNSMGGRGDDKS